MIQIQSGMKILSEIKYDDETRRYQHLVLKISDIPFVSMEVLRQIFMRLDRQVSQVRFLG